MLGRRSKMSWFVPAVLGTILLLLAIKGAITGEVISAQPVQYCYDSDRGINVWVKGTAIGSYGPFTDKCINEDGSETEVCTGRFCYVVEYTCKKGMKQGPAEVVVKCPQQRRICVRGECVDPGQTLEEYKPVAF